MLTKKTITIGILSLILSAVLFTSFDFLEPAAAGDETEESLLTFIDPWLSADLSPTAEITTDTTPPTITITAPLDSTVYTADTRDIVVQLTATDDSGSVKLVVQNLDTAGQIRQTYPVIAQRVEHFSLYPGWNTILALARDPADNVSTTFILVEYTGTLP